MKKLIILGMLTSAFISNVFASEWICYRYVDGEATGGYVKVYTDSKYEAEKKALKKYRDELGYKTDYVKCK